MNLTLDHALVALAVLGALAFLARGYFGGKKKGCSTGCGCDAAKKPALTPKGR
jgi:hypothetical protein